MSKVLVIGISVIDQIMHVNNLPKPGETILSKGMELVIGGKGLNQAVGLKRLDANVDFISVLGNDKNGSLINEFLCEEKLDKDLYRVSNYSGTSFIMLDNNKENFISVALNSNNEIHNFMDSIYKKINNYEFVILQGELNFNFTKDIIKYCYENGIKTIFNCAPADTKYQNIIPKVTYLIVNEEEFFILSGNECLDNIEDKIKKFALKNGLKNLIVTVGKNGSYVLENDIVTHLNAHKTEVTSTIGAGDSYVAGFTYGLVNQNSFIDSCEIASKIAALKIGNQSAAYGMPTLKQYKGALNG